jgi:photosystem II stability/assembly factor-like uncharacterized protein
LSIFATPTDGLSNTRLISSNSIIVGTYSEGLIVSNDDGSNWKTISRISVPVNSNETLSVKTIGSNNISSLAFYNGVMYVGTVPLTVGNLANAHINMPGGLSISKDFGNTWTNIVTINNISTNTINDVYVLDNTVLVGMPNEIALSNDNGSTWLTTSQISPNIGSYGALKSRNISKVYMAKKGNDIAAFVSYGDSPYISRSIRSINSDGSFVPGTWLSFYAGMETSYTWDPPMVNSIFVDSVSNKLYVATSRGLSIANDAFGTNISFTNYLFGSENPLIAPNGNWVVDKPGGAELPLGGNPWSVKDVFSIGQKIYVATYGTGLKFSNNGGSTWTTISTPTKYLYRVFVVDDKIYIIGDQSAGILISKDNGNTWSNFYSDSGLTDLIIINS